MTDQNLQPSAFATIASMSVAGLAAALLCGLPLSPLGTPGTNGEDVDGGVVFELSMPGSQLGQRLLYRLHDNGDLTMELGSRGTEKTEYRVALSAVDKAWFLDVVESGRFQDFDPTGLEAQKLRSVSQAFVDLDDWYLRLGDVLIPPELQVFRCPPEVPRMAFNEDLRRIPQVAAVWALAKELEERWRELKESTPP